MIFSFLRSWKSMLAFTIVTGVASTAMLVPADARAETQRCDQCVSQWDFEETAKYMGDGQHILYSVPQGVAKTLVVQGWNGRPIDFEADGVYVHQIGNDPEVVQLVQHLQSIYSSTGGTMQLFATVRLDDLNVPGLDPGTTAYDIVRSSELRGRIGDQLDQGLPGLVPNLSGLFELVYSGAVGRTGIGSGGAIITIIVETEEGKVEYRYTLGQPNVGYQKGRARSSNGHVIPEDAGDVWGTTWSSQGGYDLDFLYEHLSEMGIPISGAGGLGGRIVAIACVAVGQNGEIQSCQLIFEG